MHFTDIKFDGENIKICELGQGSRSRFKGYDALYGKGKVWTAFGNIWQNFKNHSDIVTPEKYAFTQKNISFNLNHLKKFGGQLIPSLGALKDLQYLKKYIKRNNLSINPCAISSYDAIVVTNHTSFGKGFFTEFNLRHPNILITDQAAAVFVNSKYETNELFKHKDLKRYRPKSMICKCIYDKNLCQYLLTKNLIAKNM